jgi:hypothetical protein
MACNLVIVAAVITPRADTLVSNVLYSCSSCASVSKTALQYVFVFQIEVHCVFQEARSEFV